MDGFLAVDGFLGFLELAGRGFMASGLGWVGRWKKEEEKKRKKERKAEYKKIMFFFPLVLCLFFVGLLGREGGQGGGFSSWPASFFWGGL